MTRSRKKPHSYDSELEAGLHKDKLSACTFHPERIPYHIPKTYQPDFIFPSEPKTLIEVKGRFRDRAEASKYISFIDCNPDYKIIFIFSNPRLKMPGSRPRKDGTRQSHGEWATKNGFEWYSTKDVPKRYSK